LEEGNPKVESHIRFKMAGRVQIPPDPPRFGFKAHASESKFRVAEKFLEGEL
jgi:hypothetical protein